MFSLAVFVSAMLDPRPSRSGAAAGRAHSDDGCDHLSYARARPHTIGSSLFGLGRLEMDTNVVERAIRPVTITRKNSLFAGSDAGARHWAIANTLIQTCKLNNVEPLAYLTDVLQRIVSGRTKSHELRTLLPWDWHPDSAHTAATG